MVDERKKMIAGAVTGVDGEIVSTNLLTDSQPLVEKLDQKGTTSDVESPDCLGMAIPIILWDYFFREVKFPPLYWRTLELTSTPEVKSFDERDQRWY
jgi:hypothetical protein